MKVLADMVQAFADADVKELEKDIHSTGFYHNKAKNIIACCKTLVEKYDGDIVYRYQKGIFRVSVTFYEVPMLGE